METVSAIEPSVGALPPPDAVGDDPLAAGAAELDAPEPQATRLSTSTNASKSAVIFRVIFFPPFRCVLYIRGQTTLNHVRPLLPPP